MKLSWHTYIEFRRLQRLQNVGIHGLKIRFLLNQHHDFAQQSPQEAFRVLNWRYSSDIRECLLRCCSRPPTFRSKGISICCDFVSLSSWFPWFPCLPMRVTVTIISFTCFSLHSPLLWLFKPFKLASCFISTTSFYLLTDADSADRNIQSEAVQTMQRYIRYHQIYRYISELKLTTMQWRVWELTSIWCCAPRTT